MNTSAWKVLTTPNEKKKRNETYENNSESAAEWVKKNHCAYQSAFLPQMEIGKWINLISNAM